jgi:hypothetical protein
MIDESLLKSNFIGRDGFRWWVGQIAPFESGTGQENQNNGAGWGNRQKVRILGYHPFDEQQLSNKDLPWAQVLLPTTAGSGAANVATNTKLRPSDSVFGFFLDGDNAQIPVILGVFGRTAEVSQENYTPLTTPPFVPFTGYTSRVEKPNGTLASDESNEQSTQSQKSPRDVPNEVIESLNEQVDAINQRNISGTGDGRQTSVPLKKEIPTYTAIGTKVILGNTCEDTAIKSIISQVNNLISKVTGFQSIFANIDLEIGRAVASITALTNGIVGQMFKNLGETLIPALQQGLGSLYNKVVSSFADENAGILAAVAAQKAFIEPVFNLQDALLCTIGKVVNGLGSIIGDLLRSALKNVENFVSCVGTQFVGSLLNSIISSIRGGIEPILSGVSKIISGGIDIFETLTKGINVISKIGSLFDCNQDTSKCSGIFTEYTIGRGVNGTENQDSLTNSILENAKLSAQIGRVGNDIFGNDIGGQVINTLGGSTGIAPCNSKLPRPSDIPGIRIFGGGGSGAKAEVILGSFVRNVPKIGTDESQITAGIIGVKIIDPGHDYKYPPFIEVIDNSKQGYGAIARSVIKNGKVTEIYIVSVGENYPVGSTRIDATRVPIVGPGGVPINPINLIYNPLSPQYENSRTITVGIGSSINIGISSLTIIRPGIGYSFTDIIVDPSDNPIRTGFGETIGIKVNSNGGIIGFVSDSPVAIISDDYPEIRVRSANGIGAEIKASVGIVTSISKLTQIIDCIS